MFSIASRKYQLIFLSFFLVHGLLGLYSCDSQESSDNGQVKRDSASIASGQQTFLNNCSSCHNFKRDAIGPQLGGITTDTSAERIKDFIRNPQKFIESGDERAQRLLKRYKTVMPAFSHLTDAELDALVAFMYTQKRPVKTRISIDSGFIKNPIPEPIQVSDLMVDLHLITQIPSSGQAPETRIIKLDFPSGSRELFISDLRGKMYKLVNGKPVVYLDMAVLQPKLILAPGIATGFGSFAFHPEFLQNGILYTTHAEPAFSSKADFSYADSIPVALQWVLSEWKSDPSVFPFSGKSRELFRIDMPTPIHGMQEIAFNKKAKPGDEDYGLLYIGIGDGGSAQIGQSLVSADPNKVWGSIIRIDPSGNTSKNGRYGIPSTNPFHNKDSEKFARELYAFGFRNPHRFNWTESSELLAVNIGELNIESVNMIRPGHFYGWPLREGTFVERFFNESGKVYSLPGDDTALHITYPVAQFDHDEGTAISGGFEYEGANVPGLKGKYVFGDLGSGRLFYVHTKDLKIGKQAVIKEWNVSINGSRTTLAALCKNKRVEMRFGKDAEGELYILTKADGKVYKLVRSS